jgi:DNA-binding NarL/FixJ family response regulator
MNRNRCKILIADDHALVAEGCKLLLEREFNVVGIVNDGHALIRAAVELRPDVAVVDISMPKLNGLDAGLQIKKKASAVKLVYMTMNLAPEIAAEAFRRGASGYVLKQCSAEELLIAVRRVLRNESYLSPLITKDTVEFLLRTTNSLKSEKRITDRQAEILQLFAEGKSMKEIAYILNLKMGTVAFHKYRMMESLGFKSSAELIGYAIQRQKLALTSLRCG